MDAMARRYGSEVLADVIDSEVPACPQCKTDRFIMEDYAQGCNTCRNCGMVVGDRIVSETSEWRSFENDKGGNKGDPNRVGHISNQFMQEAFLGTSIGGDASGSNLTALHNEGAMTSSDRALKQAFDEIDRMCTRMSLPSAVRTTAHEVFKRVSDSQIFRNRRNEPVLAACITMACRRTHNTHTLREVCEQLNVPRKEVTKYYSKIVKQKMYKRQSNERGNVFSIQRYGDELALPKPVIVAAAEILNRAQKKHVATGRQPGTQAGAAIYLASLLQQPGSTKPTLQAIGKVVRMGASAIRQAYQEFYIAREDLVPETYASKQAVKELADGQASE